MSPWMRRLEQLTRPVGALVAFLGLAALFYLPLLLGLRTFPDGDFTHHFLPFSLLQQRELLAGRLPLWNPYTYSGHPFLADIQAAVFYPVSNALLLPTLPWQGAGVRLYVLQVEAVLQIALGGYFTYLLLRALTRNGWAALTGGILFAFSGYLTSYPPLQLAVLRSAVWLPLLMGLLLRAAGRPERITRWLLAGVIYAVAFLAGHPQTFLHLSYVTGAWAVLLLVQSVRRGTGLRVAGGLALTLVVAAGLSAAQLLPSLEFTRLSVRADVSYAFVSGGLPLVDTWQLLLPGVLTTYSPLYIGVVGLVLVGVALAALGPTEQVRGGALVTPRAATLFFLATALIALLLSYGDNGFLYALFYRIAPGWKLFRGQERTAYLVAFGLSMAGGLGAAALPTLAPARRRRVALVTGALVTVGVYAFGMVWQLPDRTAVGDWQYLGVALMTLVLGMGAALLVWLDGWSERRAWLLTLLVAVNLFWANMGTNLAPFGPARKTVLAPEMVALGDAVAATAGDNLGLAGRVYNEFRVYEDYGMRQEIEDVWGSSPLRLASYVTLFDQFPLDRMWDLTGVEHVLTWRRELFEPSQLLDEFPQAEDTTYLHRLTDANPRARLLPAVRTVDDATAAALLADHQFDLTQTALIAAGQTSSAAVETATTGAATGASINLTQLAPDHLRVTVDSASGGLLLLSEMWLPGWRVAAAEGAGGASPLDGLEPLTVYRTNLAFMGVAVPAGPVTLDLRYRPDSVRTGLLISGIALVAVAGAVMAIVLRRRREL